MSKTCDLFWGSHGCALPAGHDGVHRCGNGDPAGPCSEYDDTVEPNRMRYQYADAPEPEDWGDWYDVQIKAFRL